MKQPILYIDNGKNKEFKIYYANDDDINRLTNEIDKLDVERSVNIILLDEISKQFKSIIEENLDVKDAVLNVIRNLEIYFKEK